MREVGTKCKKDGVANRKKGWRLMTRYPLRKIRALSIVVLALCLVWFLTGCEPLSDIQDEREAEELARKYGEELPRSELGPYRGFSRKEYFKHKCDTEAGEFIYRTVENVEGVFQMRSRESRDLIARLRKGDIPEDPWGHTNTDASMPWSPFMRSYEYFESVKGPDLRPHDSRIGTMVVKRPVNTGEKYWRYRLGKETGDQFYYRKKGEDVNRPVHPIQTSELLSRYGYTWREVRDKYDRHFGIWGGELIIKNLQTDETLAVSRGFFDADYRICPKRGTKRLVYDFVSQVLRPKESKTNMEAKG